MEVFLQYLERPDIAAAPTEEYLRTLLKRYPWFTIARLMLSRISGKVDPALSLYLATRPAPGLLLRSSGASGISPVVGTQGAPSDAVGPDVDEGAASVAGSVAMADASGMTGEAVTGSPTFEVIDRFLASECGRIVPREGIPEGDIAVGSAVIDEELATEELAEIYLAQGLNDRARAIYAKLSLLYPEKSVYFATIIARIDGNGADNS